MRKGFQVKKPSFPLNPARNVIKSRNRPDKAFIYLVFVCKVWGWDGGWHSRGYHKMFHTPTSESTDTGRGQNLPLGLVWVPLVLVTRGQRSVQSTPPSVICTLSPRSMVLMSEVFYRDFKCSRVTVSISSLYPPSHGSYQQVTSRVHE